MQLLGKSVTGLIDSLSHDPYVILAMREARVQIPDGTEYLHMYKSNLTTGNFAALLATIINFKKGSKQSFFEIGTFLTAEALQPRF